MRMRPTHKVNSRRLVRGGHGEGESPPTLEDKRVSPIPSSSHLGLLELLAHIECTGEVDHGRGMLHHSCGQPRTLPAVMQLLNLNHGQGGEEEQVKSSPLSCSFSMCMLCQRGTQSVPSEAYAADPHTFTTFTLTDSSRRATACSSASSPCS